MEKDVLKQFQKLKFPTESVLRSGGNMNSAMFKYLCKIPYVVKGCLGGLFGQAYNS